MNARDVIDEVILRTVQQGWQCDVQTDDILDALAAAGFVVVRCAPGERIAVTREAKPCPSAFHTHGPDRMTCRECKGRGVVEATTTYGLEQVGPEHYDGKGSFVYTSLGVSHYKPSEPFPLFRLVALPEETPQ